MAWSQVKSTDAPASGSQWAGDWHSEPAHPRVRRPTSHLGARLLPQTANSPHRAAWRRAGTHAGPGRALPGGPLPLFVTSTPRAALAAPTSGGAGAGRRAQTGSTQVAVRPPSTRQTHGHSQPRGCHKPGRTCHCDEPGLQDAVPWSRHRNGMLSKG